MKRVVVLGGLGLFGRTAADQLRKIGLTVVTASRKPGADLVIDANDSASIKEALRAGDLVVDAAGPFHDRSTALVESAVEVGFDIIDLNDNLQYAQAIVALANRIDQTGIRVLSSASTVSAVAAAIIQHSQINSPRSLTVFLVPATRHTANAGTASSLIRSVGQPICVFCDGRLQEFRGWNQAIQFRMPRPLGMIRGGLWETADGIHLPRVWRSLRKVTMYVDTNTPGANMLLGLASRRPALKRIIETQLGWATGLARLLGSSMGGVGYLIEGAMGETARYAIVARRNSFLTAVAPAVLAVRAVIEGRFEPRGLVSPDRHVDRDELFAFLQANGITFVDLS